MPWNFGLLGAVSLTAPPPERVAVTVGFTGQIEQFDFPEGATDIQFEVNGAQGGRTGGLGGRVTGTFVNPPSTVWLVVGGAGGSNANEPGGFNGGGSAGGSNGFEASGGGASDIRVGFALSSRAVVAGGGGGRGAGSAGSSGNGAGGGLVGVTGRTGQGQGGLGGTQSDGGAGGAANGAGTSGTAGDWGIGGTGGSGLLGGGGGGGGYYGGGGGGSDADPAGAGAGGGGGGSSFADPAYTADVVHTAGINSGSGSIQLSWILT